MLSAVASWADDGNEPPIPRDLVPRLEFLDEHLFSEFEPARSGDLFQVRIKRWLDHVDDETDQRRLLTLLDHLYFVGREEFDVLYEQAFSLHILRWLHDTSTQLGGEEHAVLVERRIESTWLCPLSDSMNINRFYHLNHIEGRNLRPDWHSLSRLGSRDKINEYLRAEKIERLVLLEDFVGSGSQAEKVLRFADTLAPELQVLFVPLLLAPAGAERLRNVVDSLSPRIEIEPVVQLGPDCVLGPAPHADEPDDFPALRRLLLALDPLVGGDGGDTPSKRAFGFGQTGSLVVLFSNCPNNAPPVLHSLGETSWYPLFPRSVRV